MRPQQSCINHNRGRCSRGRTSTRERIGSNRAGADSSNEAKRSQQASRTDRRTLECGQQWGVFLLLYRKTRLQTNEFSWVCSRLWRRNNPPHEPPKPKKHKTTTTRPQTHTLTQTTNTRQSPLHTTPFRMMWKMHNTGFGCIRGAWEPGILGAWGAGI